MELCAFSVVFAMQIDELGANFRRLQIKCNQRFNEIANTQSHTIAKRKHNKSDRNRCESISIWAEWLYITLDAILLNAKLDSIGMCKHLLCNFFGNPNGLWYRRIRRHACNMHSHTLTAKRHSYCYQKQIPSYPHSQNGPFKIVSIPRFSELFNNELYTQSNAKRQ